MYRTLRGTLRSLAGAKWSDEVVIKAGNKVQQTAQILFYKNVNIRIDPSVVSVTGAGTPKGATGEILEVSADEVKLALYWNQSNVAGLGNDVVIWVKKSIFGTSFQIV